MCRNYKRERERGRERQRQADRLTEREERERERRRVVYSSWLRGWLTNEKVIEIRCG